MAHRRHGDWSELFSALFRLDVYLSASSRCATICCSSAIEHFDLSDLQVDLPPRATLCPDANIASERAKDRAMKYNPNDIITSAQKLSRRTLLVGALQLGVVTALGARMRFLQVQEAEKFRLLAEENRINMRLLPPTRGVMFDRDGRPVAANVPNYRILLVREETEDVNQVLAQLQKLIAINPSDLEKARKELSRRSAFVPVTITENLNWNDFARVAANAPALPGLLTDCLLYTSPSPRD